jgi:hypothetical protein
VSATPDVHQWFLSLQESLTVGGQRLGETIGRGLASTVLPAEGEPWVAGDPAEEPLVEFDLSAWPTDARLALQAELADRNMEHLWRSGHLILPHRLEDTMVELLDELGAGPGLAPAPELVRFDLSTWAPETRLAVTHQLSGAFAVFEPGVGAASVATGTAAMHQRLPVSVSHAWEGAVLVVTEQQAEVVRNFLGSVEAMVELALDPTADQVAYSLDDLADEGLTLLLDELVAQAIPHEVSSDGELFVLERDEERVEAIFDRVDFPDELPAQADADLDDPVDGLVAQQVLSNLFEATDRLRRDAHHAEALGELMAGVDALERMALPFGFDRDQWDRLGEQSRALRALVQAEDMDPEQVSEHARVLRDELHQLV